MKRHICILSIITGLLSLTIPCLAFKAENVFVIIGDEFRHDESFGDKTHQYVPHLWNDIIPKGSHCLTFYGNPTFMVQVHLTILTGSWRDIRRLEPKEYPKNPTFFEVFRAELDKPIESTYFITSKKEYTYLEFSEHEDYGEDYKPYLEFTEKEKDDDELIEKLFARMEQQKPALVVVLLGGMKSFNKKRRADEELRYRTQLKQTDERIFKIWNKIQELPHYKDKTDLFFLNDHGDLITHEDCDDECKRYLITIAIGPDIKENYLSKKKWRQVNIFPTIGMIMGFECPVKKSKPMEDFFKAQ
jgi:hypothetical protein